MSSIEQRSRPSGPAVVGPPRWSAVVAVAVLAVLVGACGALTRLPAFPRGTVIDGFPVGAAVPCGSTRADGGGADMASCQAWAEMAALALDLREPEHPIISGVSIHQRPQDGQGDVVNDPEQLGPGPDLVAVLALEDETLRAVGIVCDGDAVGCRADDNPGLVSAEQASGCRRDTTKVTRCQVVLDLARAELEAVKPDHGTVTFTFLRTVEDDHYVVDFVLAHAPDLEVPVRRVPGAPSGALSQPA